MNSFGKNFRVTTFGESHGIAVGAIIDGCPAGLPISEQDLQIELNRRRPGQSKISSPRNEKDEVKIFSGVFEGKSLGTPIAAMVFNRDSQSKDYQKFVEIFRPGHADEVWQKKFGYRDFRGGGRSSGRETVGRVIAGAIAKKILTKKTKTKIFGYTLQIGNISAKEFDFQEIEKNSLRCADKIAAQRMEEKILEIKKTGDSIGGKIAVQIKNTPKFLGSPVFGKLSAKLAEAIFSIGAIRSLEIGNGQKVINLLGSQQNKFLEGISGGISNGEEIFLQCAIKPTPTISKKQIVKNINNQMVEFCGTGRHDPVLAPRIIPVTEAMVAIVLVDFLLETSGNISEI